MDYYIFNGEYKNIYEYENKEQEEIINKLSKQPEEVKLLMKKKKIKIELADYIIIDTKIFDIQ